MKVVEDAPGCSTFLFHSSSTQKMFGGTVRRGSDHGASLKDHQSVRTEEGGKRKRAQSEKKGGGGSGLGTHQSAVGRTDGCHPEEQHITSGRRERRRRKEETLGSD